MTKGSIQNKDVFLNHISEKLGRDRQADVSLPQWKHQPQWDVFQTKTPADLLAIFQKNAEEKETEVITIDQAGLPEMMEKMLETYDGGSIVITKDPRFADYNLTAVFDEPGTHIWDPAAGKKNIEKAKEANIGVIFSDISLAESGTIVQFNDKDIARSVSLLPKTYIAIVPKSTIVPRMTQATLY